MPSTPQKHHLSRDEIIKAQTLRSVGLTYQAIATKLSITVRQAQYACTREQITPKKRSGRPPIITDSQREELIEYVCHSKKSRRQSYLKLSQQFEWGLSEYAIRTCLRNAGFRRYKARRKPPLNEKNRRIRKAWAIEHRDWTKEQWDTILWTDETWVTGGRHTRTWVTRRKGEEFDPTCIVEKIQRKQGWMFWGSFFGTELGPGQFWEKEWGTIGQDSYCARIVPLIDGQLRLKPGLQLMQDGAPGHSGGNTKAELRERGIPVIFWPAYSPDLNPIETVWDKMKDYIADNFEEQLSYDRLREAVNEAWDGITPELLNHLIDELPTRCQAVIDADGGHIGF